MAKNKELKHRVLEVLEGGLRGNVPARILSITLIVLIILSILFMMIWDVEGVEKWHKAFEIIETITIGIFTLELILGFWTADVRYPKEAHPRLRYLREPMTILQILAILPFYLGLVFRNTAYMEVAEYFELLKLLHLFKIGDIIAHMLENKKNDEE